MIIIMICSADYKWHFYDIIISTYSYYCEHFIVKKTLRMNNDDRIKHNMGHVFGGEFMCRNGLHP